MQYVLTLGGVLVLLGAFMRWADRWGQATPAGQDLATGLKLWPLFLYGGLVVLLVGPLVLLVEVR